MREVWQVDNKHSICDTAAAYPATKVGINRVNGSTRAQTVGE